MIKTLAKLAGFLLIAAGFAVIGHDPFGGVACFIFGGLGAIA